MVIEEAGVQFIVGHLLPVWEDPGSTPSPLHKIDPFLRCLSNDSAIIPERITSNLAFYSNYAEIILLVFQLQSKHLSSPFFMASAN